MCSGTNTNSVQSAIRKAVVSSNNVNPSSLFINLVIFDLLILTLTETVSADNP